MHVCRHNTFFRLLPLFALALLSACRHGMRGVEALPFCDGGGWGLVGIDGRTVQDTGSLPCRPSAVVNGLFTMPCDSGRVMLYNVADITAPVTTQPFARIGYFVEHGVAPAQLEPASPVLFIDKEGRTLASTAQYPHYDIRLVHNFSEGLALFATRNGKYGYFDTKGQIAIPPLYDCAYDFCEGVALVGVNNAAGETGYSIIDRRGRVKGVVTQPGCLLDTRFGGGLLMYREIGRGLVGYMGKHGLPEMQLPAGALEAERVKYGAAVFRTRSGTGLADTGGKILLPPTLGDVRVTASDRIILADDSLWMLADMKGNPVDSLRFGYIGRFYAKGLAVVADSAGKQFYLIDKKGRRSSAVHDFIAEDDEAAGEAVQYFVCGKADLAYEKPPSLASQHDAEKADGSAAVPTVAAKGQRNNVPAAVSAPQTTDWRKTIRENPFYEEAVKVISGRLAEDDAGNRRMILDYVEHLRTSYTTKDIDFLRQLFSEKALIIVGKVIKAAPQEEKGYMPPERVIYNIKSKQQYMERLEAVFKANKRIEVGFSGFNIMRHPTQPGIYGVTLRQEYRSDLYSDDGYLFLLWDFRDKTAPKIHVRTWQPGTVDGHTPLPADSVFGIEDFNLQ